MFGVVGSGNFHVTNALIAGAPGTSPPGTRAARRCMADGWARTAGRTGLLSVHQGPGLTNAVTGITEAAKSRTPLLVLAADVAASAVRSNFRIDVAALAAAVGRCRSGCTPPPRPPPIPRGRTTRRPPSAAP